MDAAGSSVQPEGVVLAAQQQTNQGGFSSAVASGETQMPAGIQRKGEVFKNGMITAFITEGQVGNRNRRYERSPQNKKIGVRQELLPHPYLD